VSTVSICVLRAQDSGWILTNVQIVDLERGRVLEARTLHIRDDRIAAIVESPTAVQAAGLRTIDGQGSFVTPRAVRHARSSGQHDRRHPGWSVVFQDRSRCPRRSGHRVSD
jgi:predicted amidohydrolase YtcJ